MTDRCYWCNRQMTNDFWCMRRRTRDHVIARDLGGTSRKTNVVFACFACNNLKGEMTLKEWHIVRRDIPEWWRLAEYRGPRGKWLVAAMKEEGFDFSLTSNGQPYEAWWETKPAPTRQTKQQYRAVMYK